MNLNPLKLLVAKLTTDRDAGNKRIWRPRRTAGVVVDHDNALTYSAVWRAINLISSSISTLPWGVIERSVNTSGIIVRNNLIDHPLGYLLSVQSNDETDAQTFRETIIGHALSWGNGYAEIERNGAGQVVALWQIEPDRVQPWRDEDNKLWYKVNNGTNPPTYLRPEDMFHLKGLGYDGRVGYSVINYAARSIGLGMAAEIYGSSFFENGANPGGVLKHPSQLGDKAHAHLTKSLDERHAGPGKALRPMILEEGMDFVPTTIPQKDAQFIESRQFNISDVARWYGIPPHKLMDLTHATFTNIEHQGIEFVTDALIPWISRLEIESRIKLVAPRNRRRVETKIDVNGLLRGDSEARANYYDKMLKNGTYTVNMVLANEGENPIGPEGDKRLVQLNQTTLEKIGEEPVQPPPTGATGGEDEDEESDFPTDDDIEDIAGRIYSREMHRIIEAKNNYKGQPKRFDTWLSNFAKEHTNYVLQRTAHIISNSAYIDEHIDGMLDNFRAFYKNQRPAGFTKSDYIQELKKAMQ